MKKYIFYLAAVSYFGALINIILYSVIETSWIAGLLGLVGSFAMGVLVSHIAILHDKYRLLKIRIDTSDHLSAMQHVKDSSQNFRQTKTLERLNMKMAYLDEQLIKLTQPSTRKYE